MAKRHVLLSLLISTIIGFGVYELSVRVEQQRTAAVSHDLLQHVYIRSLREYYQLLADAEQLLNDHPPGYVELQQYRQNSPLGPFMLISEESSEKLAVTGDWLLHMSLQDLKADITIPGRLVERPGLVLTLHSAMKERSLIVRLELYEWLQQITSDMGYGDIPILVMYHAQPLSDPAPQQRQQMMVFNDFLLPEFSLYLDRSQIEGHFFQTYLPYSAASAAMALSLLLLIILFYQYGRRMQASRELEGRSAELAETSHILRTQMALNARSQKELLKSNYQLRGLNRDLENAQTRLKLSERLAGLGELSAGIAHEINNPVAYISSNLKELGHDLQALLDFVQSIDEASDLLDIKSDFYQELLLAYQRLDIPHVSSVAPSRLQDCIRGTERVTQIIADMRKLSRTQSHMQWCQLNDDVSSIINIARSRLPDNVNLTVELIDLPEVFCNPSQIGQVVLNVLINAIQALEGSGGNIYISEALDQNVLSISIRDDGPGMENNVASRVFEPFFTTKLEGDGTGLGLALCYKLMQEHQGGIELETAPGKGACFTLILPIGEKNHAE
ncbi:hypothetical protein HUF18_12410 [Thalassolituus sp. ST750PaO-4]|uniref:sensor histidine kinase n=1 Tax=Thalassolituus sp. ST750PaO-4 TaxID=2742965 RepID=UPI001CE29DCE|nr:ATP-binding protein [Thalassolituus sp. ST750PaO-4]MCA6060584.1 hypothetical protein [Thalassolituus sp. ST750PaO-4]